MSSHLKVCYDKFLQKDVQEFAKPSCTMIARMAVLRNKIWRPNGLTLKVRFMDGDSHKHNLVKQFAPQWSNYANLKLEFDDASDAEIRISFDDADGAWSYIGMDCKSIPTDRPTMNLGWQDEGVILHEFGHAIGLIHEHQNPLGGIKWNRQNVIRDLSGPPNNWDIATIENNMFRTYNRDQINGTALDKKSIMLYAIPASWTLDGFQSEPNRILSETDKGFIGDETNYPFPDAEIPELAVIDTKPTEGEIYQPGEQDFYKFNASSNGIYTIETEGPTDVVMTLYGPNSQTQKIAEDDDSGSDRNAKIVASLNSGIYFVQVRHYNSASGTGSYKIKVSK